METMIELKKLLKEALKKEHKGDFPNPEADKLRGQIANRNYKLFMKRMNKTPQKGIDTHENTNGQGKKTPSHS